MHNFLSELIINYVTTCLTGRTNKLQSLRSYLKVCSRLKSKNYVFEKAFLTTFFKNYSAKTHKREHIINQNCNYIIKLNANIAKNSDCDISDVMALFGCLITILAAILNFLHHIWLWSLG